LLILDEAHLIDSKAPSLAASHAPDRPMSGIGVSSASLGESGVVAARTPAHGGQHCGFTGHLCCRLRVSRTESVCSPG
jgi:hypothetical protein